MPIAQLKAASGGACPHPAPAADERRESSHQRGEDLNEKPSPVLGGRSSKYHLASAAAQVASPCHGHPMAARGIISGPGHPHYKVVPGRRPSSITVKARTSSRCPDRLPAEARSLPIRTQRVRLAQRGMQGTKTATTQVRRAAVEAHRLRQSATPPTAASSTRSRLQAASASAAGASAVPTSALDIAAGVATHKTGALSAAGAWQTEPGTPRASAMSSAISPGLSAALRRYRPGQPDYRHCS